MTTTCTAVGSVRGSCGHHHRSRDAAQACGDRDGRDVKRVNGLRSYSDRYVHDSDCAMVTTWHGANCTCWGAA